MTDISICIITLNEERTIAQCLKACSQITSDVIIVDSGSSDKTIQIAADFGARIYHQEWLGYGLQKNIANSYAKYDWILSIDGDEILGSDMIQHLKQCELEQDTIYMFKLDDYIGNRKIKYSELRAKWKKRLFNKLQVSWNDRPVHEQLVYPKHIRFIKSRGRISHYSYEKFEDFEKKIYTYSDLGAKNMIKELRRLSYLKRIFNPYFRFCRSYLIYLGFLEGRIGFKISRVLKNGLIRKYNVYDRLKTESDN